MKILHLIESLSLGGAEKRLINDLRFMDRDRFENTVVTLLKDNKLENEILNLGIRIYKLNLKGLFDFKNILRLIKIIRSNKIDIVHTQLFWADILGRIAGSIACVPVIITTVQSSVYEPGNPYLFSLKRKWLDRITGYLFNDGYIAVSEFVKKSIMTRLGIKGSKIKVIYNNVDISNFDGTGTDRKKLLRKEIGVEGSDIVFSIVGRLNPPKGHKFLFEAISMMETNSSSIMLLVIGDGPSQKELENLSKKLNIEKKVRFLGLRNDVKDLIGISDVFVFPTLSEGMPVALLEAMAMQKACVASRIAPVEEVIEDKKNGYLFTPGNSEELALILKDLCFAKEKMEEIGRNAFLSVREKFSAEKMAKELERYYEDIIKEKRKNIA